MFSTAYHLSGPRGVYSKVLASHCATGGWGEADRQSNYSTRLQRAPA